MPINLELGDEIIWYGEDIIDRKGCVIIPHGMTSIVTMVRQKNELMEQLREQGIYLKQNEPWAMVHFQSGHELMITARDKFERTEIAPTKRDYAKWEKESLGLSVGDQIIIREQPIELRVEDTRVVITPGEKGRVVSLHDGAPGKDGYRTVLPWATVQLEDGEVRCGDAGMDYQRIGVG